jgi:hypothetical protein
MIHYNVWFSFRRDVEETSQLDRVRALLDEFRAHDAIANYRILKNRNVDGKTNMPPYQAIIEFRDNEQFGLPFAEIAGIGIHNGKHGSMIEFVEQFVVEVFEEI